MSGESADELGESIANIIRMNSSPTRGAGDIHGGQAGYIVYENDGLPFVVAGIIALFEHRARQVRDDFDARP
jgi:hypothetical protein